MPQHWGHSLSVPDRAPMLHELEPEDLSEELLARRRAKRAAALERACMVHSDPNPSIRQRITRRLGPLRWRTRNALRLVRAAAGVAALVPPGEWLAALSLLRELYPEDVHSRIDGAGRMLWAPGLAGVAPSFTESIVDDCPGSPEFDAVWGDSLDDDTRYPLDSPVSGKGTAYRAWASEGSSTFDQAHPTTAVCRYVWRSNDAPAFVGTLILGKLSGECTYWSETGMRDIRRSGFYVEGRRVTDGGAL